MPTSEQQKVLSALGIDWTKIDWTKVVAIIQLLIQMFGQNGPQLKAAAAAKGCDGDTCDCCHEAICHNLQAIDACLKCCCPQQ